MKRSSDSRKLDKAFRTVGIDGCKGGWIAAEMICGKLDLLRAGSLSEIVEMLSFDSCIIDMIIGLQEEMSDVRPENEARKELGRRASTIFPAPCRQAVYGADQGERLAANERVLGKKFTSQTNAIIPKIREVDEFFQSHAKWKNRILESHPEVCFERLTGKVLSTSKHDFKGIGERADILHEYCQDISAAWIAEQAEKLKCNEDDIADAVCLSIVANLHAQHKTETIPEQPMKDKTGLLMQMIVPKIMEQ